MWEPARNHPRFFQQELVEFGQEHTYASFVRITRYRRRDNPAFFDQRFGWDDRLGRDYRRNWRFCHRRQAWGFWKCRSALFYRDFGNIWAGRKRLLRISPNGHTALLAQELCDVI